MVHSQLDQRSYRILAEFRYVIRRFLAFSEQAAEQRGLTARQHQALLAIKGHCAESGPTIGELAERLCIQHNSAVELVNRLAEASLLIRAQDPADRRRVLLKLTDSADDHLAMLSTVHLQELQRLRPALQATLDGLIPDSMTSG